MTRHSILGALLIFCGTLAAVHAEVPPELAKAVKSEDPDARIKAIMGLSKLGVEAIPLLVEALKDEEATVAQAAAYSFRVIKLEPAARLNALQPFLMDKNDAVRAGVAGGLALAGPDAITPLHILVRDTSPAVRKQAVLSLQAIVQRATTAQERVALAMADYVKDEEPAVRLAAVQALPRCGPKSVPLLLGALADKDTKVRAYAASALSAFKLEPAELLPTLTNRLKVEEELIVRQSLLRTLAKLGKDAIPALVEALGDKQEAVQKAALSALGSIGLPAEPALAKVKELALKSDHPDIRKTAVSVLGRFGSSGSDAVLELLKTDDSVTRQACLTFLGKQGGAPASAVQHLVAALKDKEKDVRALAVYVLGKMGPDAKEALPALAKLRDDPEPSVRALAEKAAKQIEGQ